MVQTIMNRLAVVSVLALLVLGGVVIPADPSGAAATTVQTPGTSTVAPPNSNILGKGTKSHYSTTALTVGVDTSGSQCGNGFISFTITNKTKAKQYVTSEGPPGVFSPFFALKRRSRPSMGGVCIWGLTAGESETFGLSNSQDTANYSTLTVTASD